jgi:hypothetical protein
VPSKKSQTPKMQISPTVLLLRGLQSIVRPIKLPGTIKKSLSGFYFAGKRRKIQQLELLQLCPPPLHPSTS